MEEKSRGSVFPGHTSFAETFIFVYSFGYPHLGRDASSMQPCRSCNTDVSLRQRDRSEVPSYLLWTLVVMAQDEMQSAEAMAAAVCQVRLRWRPSTALLSMHGGSPTRTTWSPSKAQRGEPHPRAVVPLCGLVPRSLIL